MSKLAEEVSPFDAVEVLEEVDAKPRRWKAYDSYRPSQVDGVGAIPTHWTVWKVTHGFRTVGSGTTPKSDTRSYYDGDIPWVTTSELRESVILDTTAKLTDEALRDYPSLTLYPPGTLLFAMYGATIGRLGILGIAATVNQACAAFVDPKHLSAEFTYYWLQMRRPTLVALASGGGQPNLSGNDLRRLRIPAPPLPEQRAIAAFLRRQTAKIDALVEKKLRLIDLVKEKRSALISHAVTKGLNRNAPMRPSGVEWLGDVPAHWEVMPLKFLAAVQTGLTLGKKHEASAELVERPYLRVANVQDGYLDLDEITKVLVEASRVSRYELQQGDMLMTEGGDFDKLGRGYVWDGQIEGCLHQNHIFAIRTTAQLHSSFLAHLTSSWHGKTYFTSTSSQTTNLASTNSTKLKAFAVILPPMREQLSLLDNIGHMVKSRDRLIRSCHGAIEQLNEYRSALISAAVTGKIDVRGERVE